jgi:hypothetical protein
MKVWILLIILALIGVFAIAIIQGIGLFHLGVFNPGTFMPSRNDTSTPQEFYPEQCESAFGERLSTGLNLGGLAVYSNDIYFTSNGELVLRIFNDAWTDINITDVRATYKGVTRTSSEPSGTLPHSLYYLYVIKGLPKASKGSSYSMDVEVEYIKTETGTFENASGKVYGNVSLCSFDQLSTLLTAVKGFAYFDIPEDSLDFTNNGELKFEITNRFSDKNITKVEALYKGVKVTNNTYSGSLEGKQLFTYTMKGLPKTPQGSAYSIDVLVTYTNMDPEDFGSQYSDSGKFEGIVG